MGEQSSHRNGVSLQNWFAMNVLLGTIGTDLTNHGHAAALAIGELFGQGFDLVVPYLDPEQVSASDVEYAVARADVLVLILGRQYGPLACDADVSLRELEYDQARISGCFVLAYELGADYPVPPLYVDKGESAKRLEGFVSRVKRDCCVRSAGNHRALREDLLSALPRLCGLPSESDGSSLEVAVRRIASLERENRILREQNGALQDSLRVQEFYRPIWRRRNFRMDPRRCFVAMPFNETHKMIYERAIAPAVAGLGMQAFHSDHIRSNDVIAEDIWESICTSRIVILDVSGGNRNVYYELGICHTIGKATLILTQEDDVAFNIRHIRYVQYSCADLDHLRHRIGIAARAVLNRGRVVLPRNATITD
jgi:hypothetical protein